MLIERHNITMNKVALSNLHIGYMLMSTYHMSDLRWTHIYTLAKITIRRTHITVMKHIQLGPQSTRLT